MAGEKNDENLEGNRMKNLRPKIEKAIAVLFAKVIKEPHIYFSEADLQQLLVEQLKKEIRVLSRLHSTSIDRGKGSKEKYKTLMIHREYGAGDGMRWDVAILDKSDIPAIDNANLTSGFKDGYLDPFYAFELGTEKTADAEMHISGDWEKLRRVKEEGVGYLIHVYHDMTQSDSGSGLRKKTEEKLENSFKRHTDLVRRDPGEKPIRKALFILVRGFRIQKKMMGKCEIYMPREDKWIKVNVGDREALEKIVRKVLRSQK